MTEHGAEQYREEMEKLYKQYNREDISFNDIVVLKDGKKEFVVGRFQKNEQVPEQLYEGSLFDTAYDKSRGILFCMPVQDGKLDGVPLTFRAESRTRYEHFSYSKDGRDMYVRGDATDLQVYTGNRAFDDDASLKKYGVTDNMMIFRRIESGARDVSDPKAWAPMVENQIRDDTKKSYKDNPFVFDKSYIMMGDVRLKGGMLKKLFGRFGVQIAPVKEIMKDEIRHQKRAERFGELRKMVLKKREKMAALRARQEEKAKQEQEMQKRMARKKVLDGFLGK